MSRRIFAPLAIAATLWASCGTVQALAWLFQGASFDDLTVINGSFDYDAATNTYSNWNISVLAGALSSYTYQPGHDLAMIGLHSSTSVDILAATTPDGRLLRVDFTSSLTDGGGVVPLLVGLGSGSSFELVGSTFRYFSGGSVVAVPEPGAWGLLAIGLPAVGMALFRRRDMAGSPCSS